MRYCSRCGEISNGGRCHKCGGRPVVSIATGLATETGATASVADRWQSRYASILNQDGGGGESLSPRKSVSTGIPTRRNILKDPIFQRPTNDSVRAADAPESFQSKLASLTRDKGAAIGSYRRKSMLDTLSSGSTTAESVSQQRKPIRPRIDSHLFHHYQKSLQEQSPASTAASSPASVQPSFSFDQPLSPVSTPDTVISHILPTTSEDIVKPAESPLKVADTASSKNQNCHKCNRPLKGGGPRIRLPGNNDQVYIWYHYSCLRCPACNSHFTEKQFVRVGQDVYHPKCHRAMSPPSSASTEESANSPKAFVPKIYCDACHERITTAKCVNHKSRLFHPECFKCIKCQRVLSSDQPYYDILDEPHCTACTHIPVDRRSPPVSSMSTPLLGRQRRNSFPRGPIVTPIADQQQEDNGPTSPSYVFKNRTRALPKLGGSKVCPRCHKPVAVMDDVPGPMASRWHKKCLACAKCKKQMDSSAKVTEGEQGEWLVHCSDCKDNTPKQKFVRR